MQSEKKDPILSIHNLNVWYGDDQILKSLSFEVQPRQVTALIGPANCGKSTLVRCINRLNDFTPNFRFNGEILFTGQRHVWKKDGCRCYSEKDRNGVP